MNAVLQVPFPINEPVRTYEPGTPERSSLQKKLHALKADLIEIPAFIGGKEVRTGEMEDIVAPHEHAHVLARMHKCGSKEAEMAINACRQASGFWSQMHWTERAAIFLRAAELLSGSWRDTLNAATMLGQSKNAHQAEIDAACELIDFLRFNAYYMQQIYENQPQSPKGVWNQLQYRHLEGFVLAVTPFNFTAIQGNLPTAPAMMGNTVIWKPSSTAIFSAYFFYKLLEEAGLPPGVINLLPGDGPPIGNPLMASEHFAGLHFTGSTTTFRSMWRTIGQNVDRYRSYPRIVGETGGKDFIVIHPSANIEYLSTAVIRGGFEFQGQKCSAASRIYVAKSLWVDLKTQLLEQVATLKMGPVEDFGNFVNAVIDRRAFSKITGYIDAAEASEDAQIIAGGRYNDETGFFIDPTLIHTERPDFVTMEEEIFGPVVTLYVYDDSDYSRTLDLVDQTSPYALTGAIFARDRSAIIEAKERLVHAAGNFYVNDKPTGSIVGQQPFGGGRASGTNDKAGSYLNLVRWVSTRTIKENFEPPTHFEYPSLSSD